MKIGTLILSTAAVFATTTASRGQTFTLNSLELENGGRLPKEQVLEGFGCHGPNRSPQLSWQGAPESTRSFVVTMYDPDAPTGSGWWHWIVYNIPRDVTNIPAGAGAERAATLPAGAVLGRTDFGKPGFGGACPPEGTTHRYVFTVYALKVEKLDAPSDASGALIGFLTHANSLAEATLTVMYGR